MSKIDTSTWQEFRLIDIAYLDNGNKMDKNKMTHSNPTVNFVSRTAMNNGVSDVVDEIEGVSPYSAGCITLAFGGSVGSCFLQEKPFYTGQNVGVITLPDYVTKEAKLFLISALEKKCKLSFHAFGNEINKHFKTDLSIKLPVKESEKIDFDYMENYIKELEQERIKELEQYLIATGLDDYELTDEDKKALSTKLMMGGILQRSTSGSGLCKEVREFKISDVFTIKNSHNILKSDVTLGSGIHPYITAGNGNNSVIGYISYDEDYMEEGNCIFIGGKTTVFSYQEEPFFSNDSHNLLLYCKDKMGKNRYASLFMISYLQKALQKYCWNNSISYKKIIKESFILPIQTDEFGQPVIDSDCKYHVDGYVPDWDFMERYIRAIEKTAIGEVVKFKDEIIEKTKSIVL